MEADLPKSPADKRNNGSTPSSSSSSASNGAGPQPAPHFVETLLSLRFDDAEAVVKNAVADGDEWKLAVFRAYIAVTRMLVTDVSAPEFEKVSEAWTNAYHAVFAISKKRCPHCEDVINSSLLGSMISLKPASMAMIRTGVCSTTASLMLFKAGLEFRSMVYVKGGLDLRKSWKLFEAIDLVVTKEASEKDKTEPWYLDYAFGTGIFQFIVSMVPPAFLWLAEALGFQGNRERGVKLVRQSAYFKDKESVNFTSVAANLILIGLDVFVLDDQKLGLNAIKPWLDLFPESLSHHYFIAYTRRENGDIKESLESFANLRTLCEDRKLTMMTLTIIIEIGFTYSRDAQWAKAIEYIEKYLTSTKAPGYRAWGAFELAMCYAHLGKLKEAMKWFQHADSSARDNYAWDQFAQRKAVGFIKAGSVDEFELMWHDAERLRRARRFKEGIDLLNANKKFLDPNNAFYKNSKNTMKLLPDYIGHWNWMMGRYLKGLADPTLVSEAEKFLMSATRVKPYKEKYLVPYAYYDLAELAFNNGNKQAAKDFVSEARKFDPKDYDFGSVLVRQLDLLEDRIKGLDLYQLLHGPLKD